jgi:uncharacterized paraquat-inducible protein A
MKVFPAMRTDSQVSLWRRGIVTLLFAAGAAAALALSVPLGLKAFKAWLDVSVYGAEMPIDIDAADDVAAYPYALGSVACLVTAVAGAVLAVPSVRMRFGSQVVSWRQKARSSRCVQGHKLLREERVCPMCGSHRWTDGDR